MPPFLTFIACKEQKPRSQVPGGRVQDTTYQQLQCHIEYSVIQNVYTVPKENI